MDQSQTLLGDIVYPITPFAHIEEKLLEFDTQEFRSIPLRQRFEMVNSTLIELIMQAPHESFLLAAVVDYIQRIDQLKIFQDPFHFVQFEFWLNHFSGVSKEQNALIRGKIAGKYLPREEYQNLFPVGMGTLFDGTHLVVAHLSPDLDTTIASFWGWVDAMAARVGSGQHLWCLPGGPPESPVIQLFRELYGKHVFAKLSRSGTSLTLTSMDMITQSNLVREASETSISALDHGVNEKAILLVDAEGHYLGDWRSNDVEPVRQVIILFKSCVRWFENNLHVKLISLFAKPDLNSSDLNPFIAALFGNEIGACEPVLEFDDKQRQVLESLLIEVLEMPKGLKSTFADLSEALQQKGLLAFVDFSKELHTLQSSDLFQPDGKLIENRPAIFNRFQRILKELDKAIHRVRDYVERLDISIQIKSRVLGKTLHYITLRSDVEDIRLKMSNYTYLTVVIPEKNGKFVPVGIVWAHELRKPVLGTVTFRDFCNFEEVKMASYLSVISVVDHHKSSLKTLSPPLALIGDTQSCNILVAEQALKINERYSLGNMTKETISKFMDQENVSMHILQSLLQKKMAAETRGRFFVHPLREMQEYLFFLHAILDDTDLLTKVTKRDVICVAALLNRLKSLSLQSDVEIIRLDNIPADDQFAKTAAKRILQNDDMFSLYKKIYASKESEIAENLLACAEGRPSTIFQDTKEQNGCCRVGQTKLFASHYPLFTKYRSDLEKLWRETSEKVYHSHPELDLHLHMISTIASAEEVYENRVGNYTHEDELWIWIPSSEFALRHLSSFLSAFQGANEVKNNKMRLELPGDEGGLIYEIFQQNFLPIPITRSKQIETNKPQAVLFYPAGSLNSRKAMITPYLPRTV